MCVLKEGSLLRAVPVFYPLTHSVSGITLLFNSVKWLNGNTANVVFQEFILAFDVTTVVAQSR